MSERPITCWRDRCQPRIRGFRAGENGDKDSMLRIEGGLSICEGRGLRHEDGSDCRLRVEG